jgi:hypothetical protein
MLMEDSQVNLWWRRPVDRRNLMMVVMMHWWLFHYLFDLAMTRGCCLCVTSWKCASSLSLSLSLSLLSRSLFVSLFFYFFSCLAKILSLSLPLFSFFLCLFPPLRVSFIFLIFSFLGSQQRTETLERQGKGRWSLHPRARENLMKRYHVVGRLQKGHAVSVNY